jgi:hypothetical protein
MQITHTSPVEITEIRTDGLFGDCLCFSDSEYAMGEVNAVYALEIDEDSVIRGCDLESDGNAEMKAIAELISITDGELSEDEAFELLTEESNAWSLLADRMSTDAIADLCWDVQRLQGRIAAEDGFDAFAGRDEQGTVYIVSMTGKLDRLERVR